MRSAHLPGSPAPARPRFGSDSPAPTPVIVAQGVPPRRRVDAKSARGCARGRGGPCYPRRVTVRVSQALFTGVFLTGLVAACGSRSELWAGNGLYPVDAQEDSTDDATTDATFDAADVTVHDAQPDSRDAAHDADAECLPDLLHPGDPATSTSAASPSPSAACSSSARSATRERSASTRASTRSATTRPTAASSTPSRWTRRPRPRASATRSSSSTSGRPASPRGSQVTLGGQDAPHRAVRAHSQRHGHGHHVRAVRRDGGAADRRDRDPLSVARSEPRQRSRPRARSIRRCSRTARRA